MMGQRYFAVGKTTWEALEIETGEGYVGPQRKISDIKRCDYGGDLIMYETLLQAGQQNGFLGNFLPYKWTQLLLARYGLENPAGVEIWAENSVQCFDEAKPGTWGWEHGNRGQPIVYTRSLGLWGVADRFLPELYEPENLREVFGKFYEPYIERRIALLPEELKAQANSEYELQKLALKYPIPKPPPAPRAPPIHESFFDKLTDFVFRNLPRL